MHRVIGNRSDQSIIRLAILSKDSLINTDIDYLPDDMLLGINAYQLTFHHKRKLLYYRGIDTCALFNSPSCLSYLILFFISTDNADIICMSALLTTTMNYMKEVVSAVEAAGIRDKVKIMVGGAPLNNDFAMAIGADGYSSNANDAVAMARKLLSA